jgi:hypothetical protein
MDALERDVDRGDLDELVRWVDRLAEAADWDGLVRLRDLSRAALERGRQLWPVASLAEYRLALHGPPPFAAAVLVPSAGHFALGPLSEVAASTHSWAELAPYVPPTADAAFCAHERVVRGEAVALDGDVPFAVMDTPLSLAPWEPVYPVATYHADKAEFPRPALPSTDPVELPRPGRKVDHDCAADALASLGRAWASMSNGRVDAIAVEGPALGAIAALGTPVARVAQVGPGEATALMAWAAASGGAHGHRRGMAAGRFDAWWALAALCGLDDDWPPDPNELGEAASELEMFVWDAYEPDTGWSLRLAFEDRADGLAWAVTATDSA